MKPFYALLLIILIGIAPDTFGQSIISVNLKNNAERAVINGKRDSIFKKIIVILPDTGFQNIRIKINTLEFAFRCHLTDCNPLMASDIHSGRITFQFNGKYLAAIGERIFYSNKEVLKGNDSLVISGDPSIMEKVPIPFILPTNTPIKNLAADRFISTEFCIDEAKWIQLLKRRLDLMPGMEHSLSLRIDSVFELKENYITFISSVRHLSPYPGQAPTKLQSKLDSILRTDEEEYHKYISAQLTLNGLDTTFLCDQINRSSQCNCGVRIPNQFENIYLKPCFDRNGNALSISNMLWYDLSASDPTQKLFLLKVKKRRKIPGCENIPYEFLKIKKKMAPAVDRTLAVAVIAHKDSLISIDTAYTNFFMDTASAVQYNYGQAGSAKTPEKGDTSFVTKEKSNTSTETKLRAATTLEGDLIYFNNKYKSLNFVQGMYDRDLLCMQLKIIRYFGLGFIPTTGNALATALEEQLKTGLEKNYFQYTCQLLNSIATEYQTAIRRNGNLRIYTRIIQVPNADELIIKLRKGANATPLYTHKFNVKGGVKIDFSTGIILTGLNDREFILKSVRYQYRKDTSAANLPRDTTANLITSNTRKFNFSSGLLVHVYPRSGLYTNLGLVAGVTLSNADVMLLLGGALTFRMGSGRLGLVGGLAFGKQKMIDANHSQYQENIDSFPTSQLYIADGRGGPRLPRFFTESNINTYEKRQTSWFAGITYNFASFKW